jgi:hypothetical protein
MLKRRFMHSLVAVLLFVALFCQGTGVLAGTTGGLGGTVLDEKNAPVVGATVSVASPTGLARTTTDANGKFSFLALSPDTYVVSVEKAGFESTSVAGVTVFADQVASIQVQERHELKLVGTVTSRAASSLIKPGTVGDVYSISPTQQDKIQGVGGGGNLNTAWSAIATVPGVFVAPGQAGYIGAGPSISIRGGDYDQIGYEIDGVPVNRAFDNYPSGPASSLGQQELQVYTGVPPANAQANGLSGFINQVIRTGTYPGFADLDLGIGGAAFYHKAAFEVGGSTPSRNFSYYLGIGGYNQDFRYKDNFNGAGTSNTFGPPIAPCEFVPGTPAMTQKIAPSCYTSSGVPYSGTSFLLGPYQLYSQSSVIDRDNVLNLHFGIPHKNGLKDDIQFLGMINYIENPYYSSTNDQGGAAYLAQTTLGVPGFIDGYVFNGPTGTVLPSNYQEKTTEYGFPNVPAHPLNQFAPIPANERDGFENDQAIYKLQYTHNFSSNALFKVYGYTYYSDWLNTGPQTGYADYIGSVSLDYELSSHTHGFSGSFIDQLNSQNLLNVTGSYTNSSTVRDNNTTMINGLYGPNSVNARTALAVQVSSANPTNGICYGPTGNPTTCAETNGFAQYVTLQQAYGVNGANPVAPLASSCGGAACEYYVVGNGNYATYNQVKPTFDSASITDEFKPNSKLTINGGLRFDSFSYQGADTSGTGARTLFYNAFNMDTCQDKSGNLYDKAEYGGSITETCAALGTAIGVPLTSINVTNPGGQVTQSSTEFQPRLGATYSLDPFTVLRASYGRYAQGPNSAFVQYDALQPNAPGLLYGTYAFNKFGFTSPDHAIQPEVSNNFDFSIEHQFKGDVSVKLSPFYRSTQGQIQQFYLNQQTGFVSGLNVGKQTSEGVEFELDKGDFSRQGLSARLTFAYTNSYINYTSLSNGSSVITPLNTGIANYNAYTSACAPGGKLYGKTQYGQSLCGSTASNQADSPCYTPAPSGGNGTADPTCAPGDIANPYWNAPPQGLLNPNANYPTFDILPQGIGSSYNSYGAPYVATFVVNERAGRFSVAPIFQFYAGQRYGAPATTEGIAPDFCGAILGTSPTGDPRYRYGAPGGGAYDAGSCSTNLTSGIPDVATGGFDGIGAFVAPSQLQAHLQLSYDASKNVTLVGNLTNILDRCFGGSQVKWAVANACGYGVVAGGATGAIGNVYNPGQAIQPYVNRPYEPGFQSFPFSFFLNAKIKI